MKHLLLISLMAFVLTSCKKSVTYDYMIFNETNNKLVKLKFQTIDLQGTANVKMNLDTKMSMSIYTEKSNGSISNKENGREISVIRNISIIADDSTPLTINPKSSLNWKFQKLNAHHGIYSLLLTDKSFQ